MKESEKSNSNQKGGGKIAIVVSLIAIFIITILVGVIVVLLTKPQEEEEEPRKVIVSADNVDEVIEQLEEEEKVPVGTYEVTMNTEWTFDDGETVSSNAYVENSTANSNMVYFIVTLDNGEEIYHSPYMEVGSHLEDIQLEKDLSKGNYGAVITYYLVDDEFNDLSQVSMRMSIVIEN